MKIIQGVSASVLETEASVIKRVRKDFAIADSVPVCVYRRSIDARRKNDIKFVYSISVETEAPLSGAVEIQDYTFTPSKTYNGESPFIVGMGPAGLFCAYVLALNGVSPVLIERGKDVDRRAEDIKRFWDGGSLSPDSNVQFGEGGAGTFSDGKLVTRINDPRCRFVLETFVRFGADPDILTNAKPPVGTDKLRSVVKNMRNEIVRLGGKVLFETKLTDLEISNGRLKSIFLNGEKTDCTVCVTAVGNGARDTYKMLLGNPLSIAAKPFSVGFRMEHLQEEINRVMYGRFADVLPAADYSFSKVFSKADGRAAYTFCMCPGGYVINASSEPDGIVTNGMSYRARDGKNANSAMLASVSFDTPEKGLDFQRDLEQRAFHIGHGKAPASLLKDFIDGERSVSFGHIKPTFEPGTELCDMNDLFPNSVAEMLKNGLSEFGKRIFSDGQAVLTGVETRTSAPLRILRDPKTLEAVGCKGLFPCGEGAGYSGGITSSAVDGIKVAEAILEN